MEKRRIDKKRVWINIATISGLLLIVLLILYIAYIAKTQSSEIIPTSELQGRLYADETGDVQLRFYAEDKILFKDKEERRTFENYEYKDGILLFREATESSATGTAYKFLLLTKDRIFYDNGREVFIWYGTNKPTIKIQRTYKGWSYPLRTCHAV